MDDKASKAIKSAAVAPLAVLFHEKFDFAPFAAEHFALRPEQLWNLMRLTFHASEFPLEDA